MWAAEDKEWREWTTIAPSWKLYLLWQFACQVQAYNYSLFLCRIYCILYFLCLVSFKVLFECDKFDIASICMFICIYIYICICICKALLWPWQVWHSSEEVIGVHFAELQKELGYKLLRADTYSSFIL